MDTRVVIAEDYEPTQYVLRRILEPHYEIAAVVSDGCALVEAVDEHHPNLVLLDVAMPGMSGIAAARRLKETHPAVKIIFVSAHSEQVYIDEAFRLGADGYVFKNLLHTELLKAIEGVLAGDVYSPPEQHRSR